MPFAHIRNLNRDLVVPYPLVNHYGELMCALAFQKHGVTAELRVLPSGFSGELVPNYWRQLGNMSRFLNKCSAGRRA